MIQRKIKIENKLISTYQIKLPDANLVLAATNKGYIACGYIDLKIAAKLNDVACKVTCVKTIKDLLNAKIVDMTPQARSLGIKIGMVAKEVLVKLL